MTAYKIRENYIKSYEWFPRTEEIHMITKSGIAIFSHDHCLGLLMLVQAVTNAGVSNSSF